MITPSELDLQISIWYATSKQKTLKSLSEHFDVSIKQLYVWRNNLDLRPIIENALETMIPKESADMPWFGPAARLPALFDDQAKLWQACNDYFQWNKDNPLIEYKVFCQNGKIVSAELSKMRAMTIDGLCIYLQIHRDTWYEMAKREHLANTCKQVAMILRDQKFSGAAGGLLNPMIIARDLGLVDAVKNQMVGGDPGDAPVQQEIRVTYVRPGDIKK